MIDENDFWSATDQLTLIHQWARARFAAPWAVFFAVLLRVAASTGPHVQLPGVIGGRASLNLLCAFVAPSGGGKGVSDKVARLAWPAEITELPIGSGEGIAETFTLRGKESEDNERITSAIFNCPEIDILTGLESRQGSTILGTLKAFAMGEQFGSTNASKANSRNVPAHSYRGCLSVSAQPGHTGVIFSDTSGGTPQRFLWALTIDPDMPDDPGSDPAPLNHHLPGLLTRRHDDPNIVTEIVYGPDEIRQTIIAAHLARQRGEGDALDGHWMLTRLKVAATLAIMHHRTVVSDLDWQLSATVMAVSDRTRNWIIQQAQQAARAKIRDRAVARAAGEDFYDASRLEAVKRSIIRMLENDGEHAEGKLRKRFGTSEKRLMVDAALPLLEKEGLAQSRPGEYNGVKTTYWSRVTNQVTPENPRSEGVTKVVTRDHPASVTELDSRRSHDDGQSRLSAPELVAALVAERQAAGETTITSLAVHTAGKAAGHSKASITNAIAKNPNMVRIDRDGGTSIYSIDGTGTPCQSFSEWTRDYILALPANTEFVDKEEFARAAQAAGHSAESASRTVLGTGLVTSETDPDNGRETLWRLTGSNDQETA